MEVVVAEDLTGEIPAQKALSAGTSAASKTTTLRTRFMAKTYPRPIGVRQLE